jgi:hypothetical protein
MDTGSIAGSSIVMRAEQTQQTFSASMIKQAAAVQNKMATLIAQSAGAVPQPAAESGNSAGFSTYA